jgi:hypothetical protein
VISSSSGLHSLDLIRTEIRVPVVVGGGGGRRVEGGWRVMLGVGAGGTVGSVSSGRSGLNEHWVWLVRC